MTGRTHDLAAFTALNAIIVSQSIPNVTLATAVVSIGACLIGGLAPDLDKPTSEFWQKIPAGNFLGRLLHPFIGKHRHISHSILGLFLFGWGVKHLLILFSSTLIVDMNIVWYAFMLGLISHLLADSATTEGVPLLFPISWHFGFPPFKLLRIKTGGLIEKAIVFPGLLILNGYLFYNYYVIYFNWIKHFVK